ncbi:Cof-type HAD-IIB family hydrolase [Actinomycetaceae bacterium L2_0104]
MSSAISRYEPGKKVIFLDFDGTYADDGVVPPGHVTAVREAQSNGHMVFLCTGRPRSGLGEHALAVGFDGLVCAAGGYVFVDEQVLLDRRFPAELAERTLAVLEEHDAVFILETPEAIYVPEASERILRKLFTTHVDMIQTLKVEADVRGIPFSKITIVSSRKPIEELAAEIGDEVQALPSSTHQIHGASGELQLSDVHKAIGVELVAQYLGASMEDTIAFGDGMNDIEMLAHAGTGVAIQGGNSRVLEVADMVTPGPREEGLAKAFAELGLTGS